MIDNQLMTIVWNIKKPIEKLSEQLQNIRMCKKKITNK